MKKYQMIIAIFVLGFITTGSLYAENKVAPNISNKPLLFSRSYDRAYINNKLESNHEKRQQLIRFHTAKRDRYIDKVVDQLEKTDGSTINVTREDLKKNTPLFSRSYNTSYVKRKLELNRRKMAALKSYREKRLAKHLAAQ